MIANTSHRDIQLCYPSRKDETFLCLYAVLILLTTLKQFCADRGANGHLQCRLGALGGA